MTASARRARSRTIFITGTDTGVGKTVLTGLLLHHLRQQGTDVLATKPFCCGGLADVKLFFELQEGELTHDEIAPYSFEEPVAPLVAARIHGRTAALGEVVSRIGRVQSRCKQLLVEGVGGVLVPLGEGYGVLDLIAALDCCVIVVARNRIGTINHTLLTVAALRNVGITRIKVVLNSVERGDVSTRWNESVLGEMLGSGCVFTIPFLGLRVATAVGVRRNCRKIKKTLARVADFDTFTPLFGTASNTMSKTRC